MTRFISRREFVRHSLHAAAAVSLAGSLSRPARADAKEPLYKISLAQWSLNRRLRGQEEPPLDNLDFAKTARELNIDAVEYVNQFFFEKAEDRDYLKQMKQRAADQDVKSLLIMIDREGDLGNPDESKRKEAVENHHKWVQAARFLGCHSIRVNARSDGKLSYDEQKKLAADGLRRLTEFADEFEINVLVENHGGLSSHGKWLVETIKLVDHPRCGTLPDFGNFGINREQDEWYDRYQGMKEMMPLAKAVSAKSYDFVEGKPFHTVDNRWDRGHDFLKMMRIVLDSGYRGWVGIEYEGAEDQIAGIKKTRHILEQVREKLTPEYAAKSS